MTSRKTLSFAEANKVLQPYIEEYLECVRDGFSDYVKINAFKNGLDDYGDFVVRTRAGIIHDRIKAKLSARFKGKRSIEVGEWKQVFAVKFDSDVFMRIKKFSKEGGISNFKTPQHTRFLKQSRIQGFPDEPTFIIGGYIPNAAWTELIGIYLACYNADGLVWFNKVGDYVVEQAKIIFPVTEITKVRTKPKSKSNEQKRTGTDNQ